MLISIFTYQLAIICKFAAIEVAIDSKQSPNFISASFVIAKTRLLCWKKVKIWKYGLKFHWAVTVWRSYREQDFAEKWFVLLWFTEQEMDWPCQLQPIWMQAWTWLKVKSVQSCWQKKRVNFQRNVSWMLATLISCKLNLNELIVCPAD